MFEYVIFDFVVMCDLDYLLCVLEVNGGFFNFVDVLMFVCLGFFVFLYVVVLFWMVVFDFVYMKL